MDAGHMTSLRQRFTSGALLPLLLACSSTNTTTPLPEAGVVADTEGASETDATPSDDGKPSRSEACQALDAKLQTAVEKGRANAKSPDAVLGVATPECGVSHYVTGTHGIASDALYRIGSVTKTYVATVVLKMASEKLLGLEDVVEKYVPGVKNGTTVTVRQLLNHTSGLFNYTEDATFWTGSPTKVWAPQALVDVANGHDPYFAPGTSWHYSNTNFIVLGMIAEKVSGTKIGPLVRARVLTPNTLGSTFFDGEETVAGTLAPGFDAKNANVTEKYSPSWAWSAGAMVANIDDVTRWITRLGGGEVHDAVMQAEVLKTVATDDPNLRYGLGIMVLSAGVTGGAGPGYGHGGDIYGYHTQSFHFPKKQTTIVAIVNKDGTNPNAISVEALTVLFP